MAARVEAALPRRWAAPASICRGGPDKRAVCGAPIVNGPKAFLVTSAADRVCIIFYEIVVSNYLIDVLNCAFRQFDSHDAEIRCANCMISIGKCAEKALSGRGARRRQNRRARRHGEHALRGRCAAADGKQTRHRLVSWGKCAMGCRRIAMPHAAARALRRERGRDGQVSRVAHRTCAPSDTRYAIRVDVERGARAALTVPSKRQACRASRTPPVRGEPAANPRFSGRTPSGAACRAHARRRPPAGRGRRAALTNCRCRRTSGRRSDRRGRGTSPSA